MHFSEESLIVTGNYPYVILYEKPVKQIRVKGKIDTIKDMCANISPCTFI